MGIPGFFKWISNRYQYCIKKVKKDNQFQYVDCLYFDLNCMIYDAF